MLEQAVLIGLSSWRLANLLVNEDGPFSIFDKLRTFIGLRTGPVEGFLPQLFSCIWCISVWTTILMYFLWRIEPRLVIIVAAMAIAMVVDKFGKVE